MSKLCIINTIKTKIKGNATSYIERENEIFIPKSDNFTLEQTYKIAVKKVDKINQEYLSEKFGKVVSLNTSAPNGTGIKIHPSQLLIDAYEVKEGNKSIEELNPRNLEYFNGDEALFEQEQNDELKPFIDESKKIADEIKDVEQQVQEEKIIKQGVEELFEQNSELANTVYEALGFGSEIFDVKYNRTFQNEEYHNAFVEGGLDAVKKVIEKNKKQELSAAKQLSKEVDLLLEFEELNNKTNKTNRENDRVIELYVILKNSKELDFEYSLKEIGLPNTYVKPTIKVTLQQKQQAISKFQEYVNATGRQDIEGFKEFVRKSSENSIQFNVSPNEINYELKSVEVLSSQRADEIFRKGDKNSWSIDKILTELQIPKEQKDLILSFGTRNREEILANLLANYSYTVEINTATKNEIGVKETYNPETGEVDIDNIEPDIDYIEEYDEDGNIIGMKPVLSKKGKKQLEERPTQYYSNLTVPGGTNYTENEISTPLITPSIKGHAQFATDNGIGWFRGDEKIDGAEVQEGYDMNEDGSTFPTFIQEGGEPTKTRRILEVQSDLFQKGRDKDILASNGIIKKPGASSNTSLDPRNYNSYEEFENAQEEYKRSFDKPSTSSDNQFLQLLNKDNNWVTFFVKSIIQDSAKKGYEKVLFPTGNTASKVEGHTTLEEFKKQKEDRIKVLEAGLNLKPDPSIDFTKYSFRELKDMGYDYLGNEDGKAIWKPLVKDKTEALNEINQLKQELETVEREGFGALKPIYNFYENTVANILKKQGHNPKLITDEYGNTWNEVTINQKSLSKISLNLSRKQQLENLPNNKWFKKVIQPVINRFSKMFPNIGVRVISINEIPKEVRSKVDALDKQINSFYHKGQVYIIKERVSKDITIEEFLHPFVNALEKDNPELFKSLLKEAKELFPELKDKVFLEYDKVYDSIFDKNREFLTQALTQKVSELLPEQQTWFDKFKNWLKSILDKMFGSDFVERDISQLDENMSLTELASILAENNTSFDIKGDEMTYYSLSNEEVDGYLNTPNISPIQKQSLTKVLENNKIIEFQEDTHQYFINPDGEKIELFPVSSFIYTKKFTSDFSEYSNLGNLIHDLVKQVNTSSSTITDILNRFKQSELAEFYKSKGYPDIFLDQMFTSVYDYIKALKLNGSVLVSEVSIGNQENKIAGTIDLLEIKKDGSITIHDFKSKLLGKNSVTTYGKKQTLESKFKSEENNYSKQLTLYAKMLKEILGYDSNIELQIVPIGYVGEGSVIEGVGKFELPTSYDLNNLFYTPINDNTLNNYKVKYLIDFGNKIIPSFIESKVTKVKSQEQIDREKIFSSLTEKLQNENSVEFEKQLENIFKSIVDIYKKYGSSKDELNKKLYQVFDKDGLFTKTKIQWGEIYDRLSEVGKNDPEQIKYYLATVVQYINYIEEMSIGIKNIRSNFVKIVNNEEKLSNQEVLSLMKKSFDLAQVNKTAISNTLYELKDEDDNNLFIKYLKNALSDIEGIENEYFRRTLPLISETINKYFSEEDKQRMIDEYSQRLAKAKYDADNSTGSARDEYLAEVEKWQKMIDLLPSPNIIAKVIQGEFGDSDWFFSNLFANINNDDYVIAGTEKYMQDIMRDLSKIAKINEEKMGKAHNDLVNALGISKDTPKALNEDLVYEVKQLHRKADGSTETTIRLTYVTDVDQNVYYEEDVLKHKVDITEGDEKIKAKKELSDFRKKYYESKYSSDYQKVLDSIDVVVSDGRNVKDVYNEVMQEINDIRLRNNIKDFNEGNWEDGEYVALREAWRKYNNLYSTFDRNGNKKTGADLEISEILRERRNKLNDFRIKVFNETAWESAKAKKISQLLTKYGSSEEVIKSEEYKEWQSLNTVISPTSEFYEKRKELLEKINELLDKREYKDEKLAIGLKESLNSYWEQMLAITKEYRDFEREIQANDLPESVKNQLIDLERAIDIANNQIKSLREKMSISDSKKLGDLYEQYNSMVEYKTTKYYEDDFERALSEFAILKDLSIAEVKSDNELLNEFKTTNEWFINNHIQKSRYDSTMGESVLTIEPVYYYKVIVPTNPDYIKEQPAAQYSSYELKPEALNPNYLDQFGRPNVRRDSKFVTENFRYLKLKNATDAKGKAKYQAIKHLQSFLEERQKGLDSNNYIYYSVPSKQKTISERILDDKGKGVYTNLKNKFVRNEQDEKELGTRSTFTNMVGEEAKFIPVEGKSKIDIKDQSYDIWSAALDYGLSAEKSKLFTKHMPVMEVLIDQLEKSENQPNEKGLIDVLGKSLKDKGLLNVSTSVKGKTNTRLRNVQNIIDRYFYDEWQKELKTVFGVSDVKLTNTLLGAAGSNMMMGNIPNWFVNFASGNIQIMIESAGERYFTKKDVASAKSELYTKLKKDMLSDISKTHNKSLIGQLTDYYDPMKGEYLNAYGEKFTWSKRTNLREVLFFGKNLGEYEMQMTTFIAMLKAKKVEQILPDGSKKIISLYEAYEKGDNGLPKLKEGVQFTEEQERDYMNKIHGINKKLNGAYAKMDQTFVENYSIGRLLFFMKKFFLPLWMDRYGKTRGDWELGDVREGHYIAFYNTVLKDLYRLKGNIPEILAKWNKTPEQGGYTEIQKQAIKKTFVELAIIAGMFLALGLLGYDDDEDDTDAQKYAQYFFLKLRKEIATFTPILAPQEFIGIFSRPIAAASYIGNTANLVETGIKTAIYYPTGLFEDDVLYQKKTALFEKGDSKFLALAYKFAGLKVNLLEPQQLLQGYNYSIRY